MNKVINKYKKFKEDIILEKALNTILYFSPNFRNILNGIKPNKIANDLLELEGDEIKTDVTFIDIDEKEGYVSFITMKNAMNKIGNENIKDKSFDKELRKKIADNLYRNKSNIYSKSRNPIKIGKLVNKLFSGKFNNNEIEEFTNIYKSKNSNDGEIFKIVEGEEIAYWYDYKNYLDLKGSLGSSCMKTVSKSTFEIYVKNPSVCKMLILLKEGKLIGRSLIWKLNSVENLDSEDIDDKINYFMDRQYAINNSTELKFREYAEKKGWSYKSSNTYDTEMFVTYKEKRYELRMSVDINNIKYSRYPYMDTFKLYNRTIGLLHNDVDNVDPYDESEENLILNSTSGGYELVNGYTWSEYEGRYIDSDNSVWSEDVQSNLDIDNAIYVNLGDNSGWYPTDSSSITYDEYHYVDIHIDDAVYSDEYGHYIYSRYAIKPVSQVNSDFSFEYGGYYSEDDFEKITTNFKDTNWYRIMTNKNIEWEKVGAILNKIIEYDYNYEPILKKFKMKEYKVSKSLPGSVDVKFEYLSKLDAELLGYELDLKQSRVTDIFNYYTDKFSKINTIYKYTKDKIESLEKEIAGEGQLSIKFSEKDQELHKEFLNKKIDKLKNKLNHLTTVSSELAD